MIPLEQEVSQTLVGGPDPNATPQSHPADAIPAPAGMFGAFALLRELGQGGGGRVYLASQPQLANRLVVLKLSTPEITEHLSLARLQHTNIVPLFGVYDDSFGDRALCMPFFGATTLGDVLEALQPIPPEHRHGRDLVGVLERRERDLPHGAATETTARQLLREADYVRAVSWIGACLADALDYAHQRGLLHLDVKPTNVLLAADGQPMMLDFHLASAPLVAGSDPPEYFGGTPVYMSPEQRIACDDVTFSRPITRDVDARADLYSLGVLLYVHLAGVEPKEGDRNADSLRRFNPAVSAGLADIIVKCMAKDPRDRYASAHALADDLRRHMNDQPLAGVANRSWPELWRKWRRRRPHALAGGGLVIALVLAMAVVSILSLRSVIHSQQLAESFFRDGLQHMRQAQYRPAVDAFERGLEERSGLRGRDELRGALERELRMARRACSAQDLHLLAEEIRDLTLSDKLDLRALVVVAVNCRTIWNQRQALADTHSAPLEPALERKVRHDLTELALGWAEVHVQLGPPQQEAERRGFIREVLDECAPFSPSPVVLDWYRRIHGDAGKLDWHEASRQAESAWEQYRLGRLLLKSGEFELAAQALAASLVREPIDYWANYSLGSCAMRLGQPERASAAFGMCIGLQPQRVRGYLARGRAWAALGDWKAAYGDFDRALEIRPNQTDLLVERGKASVRLGKVEQARNDLLQALDQGADATLVNPALRSIGPAPGGG